MNIVPKRLFYTLLICFFSINVKAQADNDSAFDQALANAIGIYYQALGEESPLYNGSEYIEYAFTLQGGHPFFESDTWVNGNINFEGIEFREVPILYDIVKDQVIIPDFQKAFKINLFADGVQQFNLSGHTFIRLVQNDSDQIITGFYDLLYKGKIEVLAKREKKIIEKNINLQIANIVIEQDIYYIKKDGICYSIKNKRNLLDVLKDKKKDIQQYLKKISIKFKKDPETLMKLVAEYYDKTTN